MSVCDIDFGLELKKAYEHGYADGKRDAAQWVSVEERLPEEVEDVLVFSRNGDVTWIQVAHIVKKQWWRNGIPSLCVTHWMPLPEPPKEG